MEMNMSGRSLFIDMRLRPAMEERGLTPESLSAMSNVPAGDIEKMLAGADVAATGFRLMYALSSNLGVPLDWLVGMKEPYISMTLQQAQEEWLASGHKPRRYPRSSGEE